ERARRAASSPQGRSPCRRAARVRRRTARRSHRRSVGPPRRGSSHKCPAILRVMPEPRILGMGGYADDALLEHVLGLAGGSRVVLVPSASSENASSILLWYERLHGRAELTHLRFFPWPPENLRELALAQNVILVPGGNTANALAIWRVHGFDQILREAW